MGCEPDCRGRVEAFWFVLWDFLIAVAGFVYARKVSLVDSVNLIVRIIRMT